MFIVSYQRCAIPDPLIEVVKTSSVSPRLWTRVARQRERFLHWRRINSIYFFGIDVESSRRDGWTDKWKYVARTDLSNIRRCIKDSHSLSLLEFTNTLVAVFFFFLHHVAFLFRLFPHSHILFPCFSLVPLGRSLQVLENLFAQSGNILSSSRNLTDEQDVTYRREQS